MKDLNIDLGSKPSELAGISSSPGIPEKHYPCLYLDGKDVGDELPDEGQLLISYRLRRQTVIKDAQGKKTSVDLEVISIDGVDSEESEAPKKTASDDFDSRIKSYKDSKDEADDEADDEEGD